MMNRKIGFDLDGVFASQDIKFLSGLDDLKKDDYNEWFRIVCEYFGSQIPLLMNDIFNGDELIIITARDKAFESLTKFWLDFYYSKNYQLHCVGYDKDTKKNKVKIMKENKITTFVDDNEGWIKHMVSEGIEAIHWEV